MTNVKDAFSNISSAHESGNATTAPTKSSSPPKSTTKPSSGTSGVAISYDKTTPPTIGCEDIVLDLQHKLIEAYQPQLAGIRYANIFGYLETENKGDAAIWSAQQILLSMFGITSMEACRFIDEGCDTELFKSKLDAHAPRAAILMAGGGNFNDYYHTDHPARLKMIEQFKNYPIRAFPQSIHMTKEDTIKWTEKTFESAKDLQVCARDKPSFEWLQKEFGQQAKNVTPMKTRHIMTPDIAFMFGSRPDIREKTEKTHDIYILARDDKEVSAGASNLEAGNGTLPLSPTLNATYLKIDWELIKTPGIDESTTKDPVTGEKTTTARENGKDQRAWAKAMHGFEMLAQAEFVITDRLHGHIMSTILGVPHVLMDSKLKKNIYFHDTWTKDCGCTRVADNFDEATEFARMFFEEKKQRELESGGK
ncbi:hypothetical protein K402DRAFT_324385 [Aulographum hederae CBS 113979]|uniref:Polysaccharide pyruvyl transferase domain-containing protein n=1 Tax=Aulographum hederae CBS 113979 TaxID=1176131 RepID=A0A6G1HC38_9PEZI|nr:hypothetical protein K402DRAFT_324385 [Aulographum hederae CBS 113979]